jgi:hypothetical protein
MVSYSKHATETRAEATYPALAAATHTPPVVGVVEAGTVK